MSIRDLLTGIHANDAAVHIAVGAALPQIETLTQKIYEKMSLGGRVFYIGAGTSGRLGALDASEILPTFGLEGKFIGVIAGGDRALRNPVEAAEDNLEGAWTDMQPYAPSALDAVIGLAASGTTPYVIGGIRRARAQGLLTGCIACNPGSPLAAEAEYPVEVITGPEFVTGSTRLKAGTAQKMTLNMISTTLMIRLGRVHDNRMTNMQLTNSKLRRRAIGIIAHYAQTTPQRAEQILLESGSLPQALEAIRAEAANARPSNGK
jgi:N-acetylmuramic acid 6-phosphate etherase